MTTRATSLFLAVVTLLAGVAGLMGISAAPAGAVTACTTSWKAPGTSGTFETAANWTAGVPTSTGDACLPASATPYVVTETSNRSARAVVVGAGATLRVLTTAAAGNVSLAVGTGGVQNDGTIEFGTGDGTAHNAYLWAPGNSVDNRGTFHILPSTVGSSFGVVATSFHNAANATLQADAKTELQSLTNDGDVVANGELTLDTLTNLDGASHTLSGGQYEVHNWLSLSGPIVTLDASFSIVGGAGVYDRTNHDTALHPLATITANGDLGVGDHYPVTTSGSLTNHGRVNIGYQGSVETNGTYTQDGVYTSLATEGYLQTDGAPVVVKSGYLVGGGTVFGPGVVNAGGTVAPAPHLTIGGTYSQQAGGTFQARVGGASGTYALQVGGAATLAGTLDVTPNGDLVAAQSQTFTVLSAASRSGSFTTLAPHGLSAPLGFETKYGAANASVAIVSTFDDTDSRVIYPNWRAVTDDGASAGSFHHSWTANDTASFTFTGTAVTFNTAKTTESGKAQVLIDGVSKGTYDLYAATNTPYALTYSGLSAGSHTITVKVLGQKNAASTNVNVIVDNFKVGNTVSEDNGHAITWGAWKGLSGYGLSWYSTATPGALLGFTATKSTSIDWVTRTGPDQGKAEVYLGNTLVKTVDLYSATAKVGVRVNIPTDPTTIKDFVIKVLGTKNAASTGTTVTVDAFVCH